MADPRIGKPTPTEITALAGSYLTKSIYTSTEFDYLFNEGDSNPAPTVVTDYSANAYTTTASNTVAGDWQDDGCLFVGSPEVAKTGDEAGLVLVGDLSVGVWVTMNTFSSQTFLFIIEGGILVATETDNTVFLIDQGIVAAPGLMDIRYLHENGAGVKSGPNAFNTNLSTGTLYYMVMVRDVSAKTVKCYIDGVQSGSTYSYTNDPTITSNPPLVIAGREDQAGSGTHSSLYYRVHGASRVWSDAEVLELFDDPWGAFSNAPTGAGSPSVGIRRRRRKSSIHR